MAGERHDGSCSACVALASVRLSGREITDPEFIDHLHMAAAGEISASLMVQRVILRAATEHNAAALRRLGQ